MQHFTFDIKDDVCQTTFKNGTSIEKIKTIKTSELLQAIANSSGYVSPILPPCIRYLEVQRTFTKLAIEIPPTIRKIEYKNRDGKSIFQDTPFPFPWEVFIMTFSPSPSGYRINGANLFALAGPIISMEDRVYRFPTPNVGGGGGGICFGGSLGRFNLDTITTLSQAYRYVNIFHDAPFNSDLHPEYPTGERFEDVIRRLTGKSEFDSKLLVPQGTLGHAISNPR